jgi:gamma-glutamyl:cysteine ligase YbdK (ATP-grasp superfamily)
MLTRIADHAVELHAQGAMSQIAKILDTGNGASWLRKTYSHDHNLSDMVQQQSDLWMNGQ